MNVRRLLACILLAAPGIRADSLWTDDYDEAVARARAEGRALLLNFTGSDWCGWCVRLHKEVFSQPEFEAYARSNLVCVTLDFPSERVKISTAVRKQNARLRDRHGVRGYPTILLLDPTEAVLEKTGYRPGGAEPYVAHLAELLAPHADRLVPVAPAEAPAESPGIALRTWTSAAGSTVEATFRQRVGNQVHLQRPDGGVIKIGIASLSPDDQAYLRAIGVIR